MIMSRTTSQIRPASPGASGRSIAWPHTAISHGGVAPHVCSAGIGAGGGAAHLLDHAHRRFEAAVGRQLRACAELRRG